MWGAIAFGMMGCDRFVGMVGCDRCFGDMRERSLLGCGESDSEALRPGIAS